MSYRIGFDVFYEGIPVECGLAVNAMLICETSVCFDDTLRRDAGHSFESIDVLSEARVEKTTIREELHKRMREGRAEATRVKLARKRVD